MDTRQLRLVVNFTHNFYKPRRVRRLTYIGTEIRASEAEFEGLLEETLMEIQ